MRVNSKLDRTQRLTTLVHVKSATNHSTLKALLQQGLHAFEPVVPPFVREDHPHARFSLQMLRDLPGVVVRKCGATRKPKRKTCMSRFWGDSHHPFCCMS